jgi:hypothetical protein
MSSKFTATLYVHWFANSWRKRLQQSHKETLSRPTFYVPESPMTYVYQLPKPSNFQCTHQSSFLDSNNHSSVHLHVKGSETANQGIKALLSTARK